MKWRAQLAHFFGHHRRASRRVVGMNRRNVEWVYEHNPRRHYPLVDDKLKCKALLMSAGVPVPETLAVCDGLYDIARCLDAVRGQSHFVVKPARGSGGKGILVLGERHGTEEDPASLRWETPSGGFRDVEELRAHMANIVFGAFGHHLSDRVLLERKLEPHALLASLWPHGVCDLRVIVRSGEPLLAMLRVPTSRSNGKANLHQGGIGVAVDLHSGLTVGAVVDGRAVEHHPETSAILVGKQLPNWAEVVRVAVAAAASVPLGYLGVDIVIDSTGTPVVLEMNARPGLEIQNVNQASLDGPTLPEAPR